MSTSSTDREPDDSPPDEKVSEEQVQGDLKSQEHLDSQEPLESQELSDHEILLDRFELLELIGQGGKGEIWCARDLVLDRLVAVKRITAVGFKETDVVRFQREAKAASTVDHSNVIQMLDFGIAGEQPYMVMEYVEGMNLADLIRTQGAQNIAFALEIVAQTLDGISAVHKAGIIHRDLKAENVMVLSREIEDRASQYDDINVKILDFGIAKSMDSNADATLTKQGAIVGTPRFMSPEQAQGKGVDRPF
jgi:Serine/threonine protein kinase